MVRRPDRPYWFNWAGWHLYHRHRTTKVARRQAAWDFINVIRRAPPGAVAIDCGANIGNVTAALLRAGYEVYAFEPDPMARAVLEKRFDGRSDVHIQPAAVGVHAATETLYRAATFAERPLKSTVESSLVARPALDPANGIEVEVVDLVAFIRRLGRPVHLLKMDIEGAEVAILERLLDEQLDKEIDLIFAETHERFSPDLAERTLRLRQRIAAANIRNVNLDWF